MLVFISIVSTKTTKNMPFVFVFVVVVVDDETSVSVRPPDAVLPRSSRSGLPSVRPSVRLSVDHKPLESKARTARHRTFVLGHLPPTITPG